MFRPAAPPEFIDLTGDNYDVGYQHGAACKDVIHAFLSDRCARVLTGRDDRQSRARLLERAELYRAAVERVLPHLSAEIDGLSAGAGITRSEAALLQFRREINRQEEASSRECTLIGLRNFGGSAVIAQNIDLTSGMAGLGLVVRVNPRDPAVPRALIYTFAGLLGFVGMNDSGVAIGINMVFSEGWKIGISPYLLVRHLLRFRSARQCFEQLDRIERSSSRALTICDGTTLGTAELTVTRSRVIQADVLYHTNHYLHPELVAEDRSNVFSRNSSRRRLEIAMQRVPLIDPAAGAEGLFGMLSDHSMYPLGLCVHSEGNENRDETAACVVMRPRSGELLVRRGNPCIANTQRYCL